MKIDVKELVQGEIGESLPVAFQADKLVLPDLPALRKVALAGELTWLGDDRLLSRFDLTGKVELECSRCLETFAYPLALKLSDEYVADPSAEQFPVSEGEVDLRPAVRAAVLVELPVRPLHDPDCRGLCPECGKNLNQEPHQHSAQGGDNPFAVLKKLKK